MQDTKPKRGRIRNWQIKPMHKGKGFLNLFLNAIGSTVTARPKTRKNKSKFDTICFVSIAVSLFLAILFVVLLSGSV